MLMEDMYSVEKNESNTKSTVELSVTQITSEAITFVVTVLEDAINQLSVLRHKIPGCVKVPNLENVPLRKRLGIDERDRIFNKTGNGEHQSDTVGSECFTFLTEAINVEEQQREEESKLKEDLLKHINEVECLMNAITQIRMEQRKGSQETIGAILHIKNEVHDQLMVQRLCASFTAKWEHTRQVLNKRCLSSKEDGATQRSDSLQKSLTTEIHTHAQYCAALDKMIVDLENDIVTWTKKRELDVEEKNQQILNLKIERSRNQRHLDELKEEYASRQAEIDEFLAYKKEKLERIALEKLLTEMATRIQAWWRGNLCRKRLRAKKKGKGKKGGKGKKKKGKGKKGAKKGKKKA